MHFVSFLSARVGVWARLRLCPSAAFSFQNGHISPRFLPIASYFPRHLDSRSYGVNAGSSLKNKLGIFQCNWILPSTYEGKLIHSPRRFLDTTSSCSSPVEPPKPVKDDHNSHPASEPVPTEKPSLFQRFKQMYKEYWYVVVPVHCFTSVFWFGGFYYLTKSGFDVLSFLENMNISEAILKPLKETGAGYLAVSYALFKIASPARYTVTLGGTTVAINYLKKWGYIKPMPTRDRVREMIKEKGDELKLRRDSAMARFGRTSEKRDADK